jgi:hypothetical protein
LKTIFPEKFNSKTYFDEIVLKNNIKIYTACARTAQKGVTGLGEVNIL